MKRNSESTILQHELSDSLRVAVVQPDLHWLDPAANLRHLTHLLSPLSSTRHVDLIVLPEMFTSGFTQKPEGLYGDQATLTWMQQQATCCQSAIVGSVAFEVTAEASSPRFVNRLFFVMPDGSYHYYDKSHLFRMGGEHERYQAGNIRTVVTYKGWRILLTICYDLRFPVFCRNQADYDVMLCVANWPKVRRDPWRTLLQARSIENQSYVLGANRVGVDGNGLQYSGDSVVIDPAGQYLADVEPGTEVVLEADLVMDKLLHTREAFPVLEDADPFKLL